MLDRLEDTIREYGMLPRGTKVLCALSGGADSVCLLSCLYRLRDALGIEVAAAHYNHRLRGEESRRDEEFVRRLVPKLCDEHTRLLVGSGDVAVQAARTGRGIEETAREMRYTFLREAAREIGADVIATAHNLNDNAETILMHMMRGSGLRGLTGIPPVGQGLIRPMLNISRQEIEDYLHSREIPFVEDSTNAELAYSRNRVRHQLLPRLEELSPGVLERMGRMACLMREDEEYLQQQGNALLESGVKTEDRVELSALQLAQQPRPVGVRAVRAAMGLLTRGDDNCTQAHLQSVLELCSGTSPSARVDLPGGLQARREYDRLVLCRPEGEQKLSPCRVNLPGETEAGVYRIVCREGVYRGEPQQPFHLFLSKEKVPRLLARARQTGDSLKRPKRKGKTVKKLLIDEKIPLDRRDLLPVLEVSGQVAAVAGLGVDEGFCPRPGEPVWEVELLPRVQGEALRR